MAKSSYVLEALKILGLDEILKLSEVLLTKQVPLKKAAGEELIVWDETPAPKKPKTEVREGKVLPFPQKTIHDIEAFEEPPTEIAEESEASELLTSDFILWQRELQKKTEMKVQKKDAFKGYEKSTEMYVVKTTTHDGKDKLRFAATDGVLINKKQA